jgi:single-strand DNA-binding protein
MLNKVMLIGNVGQDLDIRFLPSGDQITNLTLATSRRWKDKNGERQEETTWHNVTMFGSLAKIASEYVKKGSKIYIEGRIKNESWEKDGEKKYRTVIIAETMHMLDRKRDDQNGGGNGQYIEQKKQDTRQSAPSAGDEFYDDDIPF